MKIFVLNLFVKTLFQLQVSFLSAKFYFFLILLLTPESHPPIVYTTSLDKE